MGKARSVNRIHSLFERALADDKLQKSVNLSCCGFILAYCLITNHYIFISGSTGTPGGNKMEKTDQNETLFRFSQQLGATRSISHKIELNKHGLLPSHCHLSGSKICDDQTKSTPNSDMGSLDSDLTNKS